MSLDAEVDVFDEAVGQFGEVGQGAFTGSFEDFIPIGDSLRSLYGGEERLGTISIYMIMDYRKK